MIPAWALIQFRPHLAVCLQHFLASRNSYISRKSGLSDPNFSFMFPKRSAKPEWNQQWRWTDASISWKRVEVGLFSCFLWVLNSTCQKNLVAPNYVVQGCELSKEVIFLSGRSELLAMTEIYCLHCTLSWLNEFSSVCHAMAFFVPY